MLDGCLLGWLIWYLYVGGALVWGVEFCLVVSVSGGRCQAVGLARARYMYSFLSFSLFFSHSFLRSKLLSSPIWFIH